MDNVWTGVLIGAGALLCGGAIHHILQRRRQRHMEAHPMLEPRIVRQWKMRNLEFQQYSG
jgi:hypothetical protein